MEESFIESASEVMGDRFTEATEKNFRILYAFACEKFIEGYNNAVGQAGGEANRI